MNKAILIWPIVVIIVSCILGGSYYLSQIKKQESIEKQQRIELLAKQELAKKEYIASQKKACLEIYQSESKKWNNANSWNYEEISYKCIITYKATNKKTKAQCEDDLNRAKLVYKDNLPISVLHDFALCVDGFFESEF